MSKHDSPQIIDNGNGDEPLSNHSGNRHFADILDARLSRRTALRSSLGASIGAMFGSAALVACGGSSSNDDDTPAPAPAPGPAPGPQSKLGFTAVPVSNADTVVVPTGYSTQVLVPWGTPIMAGIAAFDPLTNTGADQGGQMGSHHDGMHFFPIEGTDPWKGSSTDGLLVMNHEYVEPRFMHASARGQSLNRNAVPALTDGKRPADEVLKELNAHGVSIVRVQRQAGGQWQHVQGDRLNRRITGLTEMEITGPVRGAAKVQTKYSPDGTRTRGTLNNCAHGVTPWNTYMASEENWAGYFVNRVATAADQPREQTRYGVPRTNARYGWDLADSGADEYARFDITAKGDSAHDDYRNEVNTFGWMVEIDPFNPASTPKKRTTLGRFGHEGVVFHAGVEGKPVVCYSGDDSSNEYIYKFVSAGNFSKAAGVANGDLLNEGTLYVARFNEDGTGQWLPLVYGTAPLVTEATNQGEAPGPDAFADQADVLINTRRAADLLGATPMDRPEWGAIDPTNGQVYFTLTNNGSRSTAHAANPRTQNRWGHIIRWAEAGGDPAATAFNWDIFILAGPEGDSSFNGQPLTAHQIVNSPDGLWFDHDARLWIQSDIGEGVMNTGDYAQFGNNQMLAADPVAHDLRRFLTGPIGQEITGVVTTPDGTSMFINVQHPGATTTAADFAAGKLLGTWPNQGMYPRSATVVITKDDGGKIGT
ncbi:MAG: PhoX family phosphatase [Pseudomonadota bacterium]|nr:PhoX family phosphatase [Pseudomonadota bacterium]